MSRIRSQPRSRFHLCDQGRHARSSRLLRQLSGRQSQLRDCGVQGTAARMSQETVAAQTCSPVHRMARTSARLGGGGYDYGTESFCNGCGSRHHSLYANRDSIHRKNSPFYGPSVLLINRKATAIAVRPESNSTTVAAASGTALCLHWNPQTLRCVRAKTQCTSAPSAVSPSTWRNQPGNAPASWRNTRVCHAQRQRKKWKRCSRNSRSDRAAAPPAPDKVCSRAVLPGSGGPEHQATRAVSQPTDKPVVPLLLSPSERRKLCDDHARRQKDLFVDVLFQHPRTYHSQSGTNYSDGECAL